MKPLEIDDVRTVKIHKKRSLWWAIPQTIVPIAVIALAVFGAKFLVATKKDVPQRPPREQVYIIDSVKAAYADHRPAIQVYGSVVAGQTVDLRALVAGEVVASNPALKVGARVSKGDELLTIDRFNYEGAVTEARANLAEVRASLAEREALIQVEEGDIVRSREQLELAKKDLARAEKLLASGNVTPRGVDERRLVLSQREQSLERSQNKVRAEKATLERQRVTLARLEWRLEQAERNLRDTVLKAPFDGVVMSESADLGRLLNVNDVAVSLYDVNYLEVRFTLSDFKYGQLLGENESLIGRKVSVTWNVGEEPARYEAVIDRVGAEINPQRGGVDVFARIVDERAGDELRPGAFVQVSLPGREFPHTVRLPETAVYGGDHVFIVKEGRLERREVSVAAYDDDAVLVTGSLDWGDDVLTTRIAEVGEGLRVRGEKLDKQPKSAAPSDGAKKPVRPSETVGGGNTMDSMR